MVGYRLGLFDLGDSVVVVECVLLFDLVDQCSNYVQFSVSVASSSIELASVDTNAGFITTSIISSILSFKSIPVAILIHLPPNHKINRAPIILLSDQIICIPPKPLPPLPTQQPSIRQEYPSPHNHHPLPHHPSSSASIIGAVLELELQLGLGFG